MLQPDSILKGFPLGFGPADVRYSFADEADHERVFAFDLFCIHGEELRDSVRHHLLEPGAGDARSYPRSSLSPTEAAAADADTVVAETNAASDPDPIDEQRGGAAFGGQLTVDNFVPVDQIRAINYRMGDLDNHKRAVRLPRLIDR